jgi:hypothetical protein
MANPRIPENVRDKAEETAASAGHTAQEAKGLAREAGSAVAAKAQEAASTVAEKTRGIASAAGERADEALSSVGQGMSSLAGTIRQRAPREGMLGTAAGTVAENLEAGGRYLREHDLGDIGGDLTSLVRQHPLPAVLCVFGIGFLLGTALRR